jgi:hypothetical protein
MLPGMHIQPLPLFYDCNDYHVILFLEDHPWYESMEAMIREDEEGGAVVRAIITRQDKSQVDHTNDPELPKLYKKREVHCTPVRYKRSQVAGRTRIQVGFESFQGEDILMDLLAASPATREHSGLLDPLGHSRRISLPVMYPERVALTGPESTIHIQGREHRVGAAVPARAMGGRGYYSEDFRIGVLRASHERLSVRQAPERLEVGARWVYEAGGRQRAFEVTSVRDDLLRVEGACECIEAGQTEHGLALRKVSTFASSRQRRRSDFSICFTPGLPFSPAREGGGDRHEARFSISIDERTALITGTARSEREQGRVRLMLAPEQPGWAAGRNVSTLVTRAGDELHIDTELGS